MPPERITVYTSEEITRAQMAGRISHGARWVLSENYEAMEARLERAREALDKIAARRPSQFDAAAAFFRSRQDAREALAAIDQEEPHA